MCPFSFCGNYLPTVQIITIYWHASQMEDLRSCFSFLNILQIVTCYILPLIDSEVVLITRGINTS